MIIKVQNSTHQDKFTVEAAFIRWLNDEDQNCMILEVHVLTTRTKRIGDTSLASTGIERVASLDLKVYDGDIVYIMNDEGKTIDSKHIVIGKEPETCEFCLHIEEPKHVGGDQRCFRHLKRISSQSTPRCSRWEWNGGSEEKPGPTCIQCGYAMGEREGVPLCPKCNEQTNDGTPPAGAEELG